MLPFGEERLNVSSKEKLIDDIMVGGLLEFEDVSISS
jgi:hypothetical protein